MPVRFLRSSVLKWPDKTTVHQSACAWAKRVAEENPTVARIGYIGSYARGDWGVGSDIDLILVVERTDRPFVERALAFDTASLSVPADVRVYTQDEFESLLASGTRFGKVLREETVWVFDRAAGKSTREH